MVGYNHTIGHNNSPYINRAENTSNNHESKSPFYIEDEQCLFVFNRVQARICQLITTQWLLHALFAMINLIIAINVFA